jgi:hypothetical protein
MWALVAVAIVGLAASTTACGGDEGPVAADCVRAWNAQSEDDWPRAEVRAQLRVGAGARVAARPPRSRGNIRLPGSCHFVLVAERVEATWAYGALLAGGRLERWSDASDGNPGTWEWRWQEDEPRVRVTADGGLEQT